MNKARAKECVDTAAEEIFRTLFQNLRSNKSQEQPAIAIEQFTAGTKKLEEDIRQAKTIIDSIFPD